MSTYKVGLQHAGSFISSGKPFLKTNSSLADGATEYIKFPNVTKKIKVKNHSASGVLKIGFADNARRGFDMPGATVSDRFEGTFASSDAFTISFWIKPTTSATVARIIQLDGGAANTRLQGTGSGALKFFVDGFSLNSAGGFIVLNQWTQITMVINDTDNKVYVNGALAVSNSTAAGSFTGLTIGADSANYDDIYDDMYLFNAAFTPAEVSELYTLGYFDPRNHTQAANLTSWWAFEDNAHRDYFDPADTTSTINDRISSNNLTKAGTGTGTFVNGRHLDTAVNSHSLILSPGAEIELNVKTKSMFLFADGATQDFDVYASLTNIPSERMYDLTGPGIDE
tara:strand:+ start:1468 stop:2487 length:1020 start_codon:yes stop_codon:yes gene_type:complete